MRQTDKKHSERLNNSHENAKKWSKGHWREITEDMPETSPDAF
jgi:hypothetical protein